MFLFFVKVEPTYLAKKKLQVRVPGVNSTVCMVPRGGIVHVHIPSPKHTRLARDKMLRAKGAKASTENEKREHDTQPTKAAGTSRLDDERDLARSGCFRTSGRGRVSSGQ